jgi:hypothetical protein
MRVWEVAARQTLTGVWGGFGVFHLQFWTVWGVGVFAWSSGCHGCGRGDQREAQGLSGGADSRLTQIHGQMSAIHKHYEIHQ